MTTDTQDNPERVILFVAGRSPRSERARANLRRAISDAGVQFNRVDEIDLLERPQATVEYGVYATPVLIGYSRNGASPVLYGDLSEEAKLQQFITEIFGEARVPG